jgi:radical SAM superfamily enzyme YgiQ (UPF0313 family)
MRIALVQSWQGRREPPVMPLGPGVLAAALGDREVAVIDPNPAPDPLGHLRDSLVEFEPHVIGFSLRNVDTTQRSDRWSYLPAFAAQLDVARKACPGALVVAGGAGFSLFPRAIAAKFEGIDVAISGEAEEALPSILDRFEAGGGVPGVLVAGSGPRVPGSPSFEAVRPGVYRQWERNLSIGVEVSRGCAARCSYCSYALVNGSAERRRPPGAVVSDMEALFEGWGIRHVFLASPLLNSDKESVSELLSTIADRGLPVTWEGYFGPRGLDGGMAALAVRSGCTGISLSPDAATARGMLELGKGFAPADVAAAIDAVRKTSLRLSLNIFPVLPGGGAMEIILSFARGLEWSARAGRSLRRLRFGTIRMVPGTVLSAGMEEADLLEPVFYGGKGLAARIAPLLARLLAKGHACSRR